MPIPIQDPKHGEAGIQYQLIGLQSGFQLQTLHSLHENAVGYDHGNKNKDDAKKSTNGGHEFDFAMKIYIARS